MLETKLGYEFQDKQLLEVVTIRTAAVQEGLASLPQHELTFSRLKFLGSRVLSLLISDLLFSTDLFESEGVLTEVHSRILSHDGLIIKAAKRIGLAESLIIGRGERIYSVHTNNKVLFAHMQALFGALWTDCQSDYARILEVLLKIFQISNIMRSNNRLIEIPEGFAPLSRFDDLQARFGHVFANRELLLNACIRQSALNESLVSAKSSFQTLEFLGDKVLGCIVAGWLIANCKEVGSDVLTPVFNELVGNLQILPDVAIDIRLGDALIVGAGEEKVQVRLNRRRLADHMEALIAALWLDVFPDYEKTARTVIELFNAKIKSFLSKKYCTKEQILFDHTEFPSLPAPASSVDKEEAVDSGGNLSETYASIVSKSSPPRKRQVLWSTWSGTSNTSSGAPRTQQSSTKFKAPYLDDPEEFPPLGAIRRR